MQELAAADALRRHLQDSPKVTPLAPQLKERLQSADGALLVHAAKAYATLRVRDPPVLQMLQRRTTEALGSFQLKGRALAEMADHLGKLASRGDAFGRRASRTSHRGEVDLAWKTLAHQLGKRLKESGNMLRLIDFAVGLGGVARLGSSGEVLLPLQQHVLLALQGKESDFAHADRRSSLDPRHVATLVASYAAFARLRHRDDAVLDAAGAALERCGRQGQHLPSGYLLPFLKSLATQLRPAPPRLARVLEVSLPPAVKTLSLSQLEVVVEALAFIPHLRSSSNGLGPSLFNACLGAPLSAMSTAALVGAMRSAWALGYEAPGFWAPCLQEAQQRSGDHGAWAVGDVANGALLAAKVASRAPAKLQEPKATMGPAPDAASPRAWALLESLWQLTLQRMEDFGPRELGILAMAMVKSDHEDGHLFAALSHRALELLHGRGVSFNQMDFCQLLVALAHFRYRDELLLKALATQIEASWESGIDSKARDIVLWSFSNLGGVPGAKATNPKLAEALVEYELTKGTSTERTDQHLTAAEILPVDMAEFTETMAT